MAFNDIYGEDETCPTCNKNLNDVINGKEVCISCENEGEALLARQGVLQHLVSAVTCMFHFRFDEIIPEVIWAVQRLFKCGDYHPTKGKFYKLGYL
jgi:hypothetical protein